MADDDRRAEIEAALAAWPRYSFIADGLEPSEVNPSQRARREALLRAILPALDRVCDARGDDEAGTLREGLQRILDLPCPLGREGDWLGKAQTIASETISAAARSPQGEDHEARVEMVARILGRGGWRDEDGVWHEGITVRDWSRAADIVAALDDLSRVSPSRDGTVAVEDVDPPPIEDDAAYWRQKYEEALHVADVRPQDEDHDRALTNDEGTVLVNIWGSGQVDVAFREGPSAVWGPPVTVVDR